MNAAPLIEKLAAYEDTGLMPDEVAALKSRHDNAIKLIQDELEDSPLSNYEENDFNAGYQAGLDWVLKYVLKGGEEDE
jgi:hypothetical protein